MGRQPTEPGCGDEVAGFGKEECEGLMEDCWHRSPDDRPQAWKVVKRLGEILEKVKLDQDSQTQSS